MAWKMWGGESKILIGSTPLFPSIPPQPGKKEQKRGGRAGAALKKQFAITTLLCNRLRSKHIGSHAGFGLSLRQLRTTLSSAKFFQDPAHSTISQYRYAYPGTTWTKHSNHADLCNNSDYLKLWISTAADASL